MTLKKSKANKILSHALPTAVVLILLCGAAFCGAAAAEPTPVSNPWIFEDEIDKDNFDIIFEADITSIYTKHIAGKKGTIDLNGHILSISNPEPVLDIYWGGDLTIKDSSTNIYHYFTVQDDGLWLLTDTVSSAKKTAALPLEKITNASELTPGKVIKVTGGCITGGHAEDGGAVDVRNDSKLTMDGGNIIGNRAAHGGGVCVRWRSSFTMNNGAIAGNIGDTDGGGVFVRNFNNIGTFTMNNGIIVGNCATYGGGVKVDGGCTFTMNKGKIAGNSAWENSGGVDAVGTFTMSGGEITGNSASKNGGGVYVVGTFNVTGAPVIKDNRKNGAVNNVQLQNDRFVTLIGGLTPYEAYIGIANPLNRGDLIGQAGGSYSITETDTRWFHPDYQSQPLKAAVNGEGKMIWEYRKVAKTGENTYFTVADAVTNAGKKGTVTLIDDSFEGTVNISKAVTLDLNGHVLSSTGSGPVIVANAGVTVEDSSPSAVHWFEYTKTNGAWTLYIGPDPEESDTVKVYTSPKEFNRAEADSLLGHKKVYVKVTGGVITGGNSNNGGGIYVGSSCTLTMTGGTVIGNSAQFGGGVDVSTYGKCTLSGTAEIIGNSASLRGGGVEINPGSTFTLSGPVGITGNSSGTGGGVYITGGTFTMNGGSITQNVSGEYGGGVMVNPGSVFNVKGSPVIRDNTKGTGDAASANNVYLIIGRYITVTGALQSAAYIGITEPQAGQFGQAGGSYSIKDSDALRFHPDGKEGGLTAAVRDEGKKLVWMTGAAGIEFLPGADQGTGGKAEFTENNTVVVRAGSNVTSVSLKSVSGVVGESVLFTNDNTSVDETAIPAQNGMKRTVVSVFNIEADAASGAASFRLTIELNNVDDKEHVVFWHYTTADNMWDDEPLKSEIVEGGGNKITYKVETDSFSPFAVTIESAIPQSSHSSKSQGTSIWLTAEPTPTETPTPTPTPTPEAPSVKPLEKPVPSGASPAPLAGILAGLGAAAAAVFMRKRA